MTEKFATSRDSHRVRSRRPDAASPESDVLQAVFGFAFTIQQEIQKLRRETNALRNSLAPQVELQQGFPPALGRIVASAQNLTEAAGAAIGIGSAQNMICIARSGSSAPPIGSRFDARSGLGGECVRTREMVICVNAAADPRVDYNACIALGVRSMVYLPLLADQKLIGVMAVFSSKAQHFSVQDLNCLRWAQALVIEALSGESGSQVGAGSLIPELIHPEPLPIDMPRIVPEPPKEARVSAPVLESPLVVEKQQVPRVEPTFMGTIVDDLALDFEPEVEKDSPNRRMAVIIAIVLIVIFGAGVGLVVLRKMRHEVPTKPVPAPTQAAPAAMNSQPSGPELETPQRDEAPVAAEIKTVAGFPEGVQFALVDSQAILKLQLPEPVTFEGYSLSTPNRVYFDLHGVNLVGAQGASVPVEGGIVSRIRISIYRSGITRVVFDLNGDAPFHVKVSQNTNSLAIALGQSAATDPEAITPKAGQVVKITADGSKTLTVPSPPQSD